MSSPNFPTPTNPLKLTWINNVDDTRSIPSLKNRRTPVADRKGRLRFIVNAGVQRFIKSMEIKLIQQWSNSGFSTIELPKRVCVYGVVAKYVTKDDVVPVSDLDNQYTTIQEMLQNGLILEDDKQISSFFCEEKLVYERRHQYAKAYVWVDDGRPRFMQYLEAIEEINKPLEEKQHPTFFEALLKFNEEYI